MDTTASQRTYSGFWPFALIGLSMIILLAGNLVAGYQQMSGAGELLRQQVLQLEQAAQVEGSLKAMMTDLIELGKVDNAAAVILKKYRIAITPPAAAADGATGQAVP